MAATISIPSVSRRPERSIAGQRDAEQESIEEWERIADDPPNILLTNYVMPELLTRRFDPNKDRRGGAAAKGLDFLILDRLCTYRGRQGTVVATPIRRMQGGWRCPWCATW